MTAAAQVQPRLCYVVLAMNLAVYAAGVGIALTQVRPFSITAALTGLPTPWCCLPQAARCC